VNARVLILLDNDFSRDARVEREGRALAGAGHRVTVLCFEGPGLPREEERDGVRVLRVPRLQMPRFLPPGFQLAWYLLRLARDGGTGAMERRARSLTADVVHACDLRTLALGVRLARRLRARLVYDCHDLWAEFYTSPEPWRLGTPITPRLLGWLWHRVERKFIRRPDETIVVSDAMADHLVGRYGIPRPVVVRNCPPFRESGEGRLREELGAPEGARVVLYHGVALFKRALGKIVEAAELLPENCLLALRCTGSEARIALLKEMAAQSPARARIRFLDPVPQETLAEHTAGADVGLALLEDVQINQRVALPNKIFEYMRSGVPVVASAMPEMRRVIETERVGGLVHELTPEAIARAIREVLDAPDHAAMRERARTAARERHNWSIEAEKLLALYARVLAGAP